MRRVRTQKKACSSDSRFRRKLSGTTGHRLLGTLRPQMLCVAAWVWFCLSTEFVSRESRLAHSDALPPPRIFVQVFRHDVQTEDIEGINPNPAG